jgi:hypothetical protein
MKQRSIVLLCLLLSACSSRCGSTSEDAAPSPSDAVVSIDAALPDAAVVIDAGAPDAAPVILPVLKTFTPSQADFLNPERGFYTTLDLTARGQAARLRQDGYTLAYNTIRLDKFRTSPLTQEFFDTINGGLAEARAAGIKMVIRFAYNKGISLGDASREIILTHINQLQPLLQNNADVIAMVQAGFIGAWGEWHASTNGLDNDTDRGAILNALLAAVPSNRTVQLRTPMFKSRLLGGPLTAETAFSGTNAARVGQHNDCFLASDTDYGTYASPIATWKAFVAQEGRYTPVGGETCNVYIPRSDCLSALNELREHHWTYLNWLYNQAVLSRWAEQGCLAEVRRNLGYRFVVQQLYYTPTVRQNGNLTGIVTLSNLGYAAPINPRTIYAVLSNFNVRYIFALDSDVRTWLSAIELQLNLPIGNMPKGEYELALWLPDAAPSLSNDIRYAIRFANEAMWNELTGDNFLGLVTVE